MVYDTKEVKVHVKVEQNQDDNNKTKVTVTYDGTATAPTFNNTYDAKGSVTLTATKTIKVADGFDHTTKPADGEFTFDLKDAAGNVIATANNDADGKINFTRAASSSPTWAAPRTRTSPTPSWSSRARRPAWSMTTILSPTR